jgi:hypothetical protein
MSVWGIPCWRFPFISACTFPLYITALDPPGDRVEGGTIYLTSDHAPDRSAAGLVELSHMFNTILFSPPIWARDGEVVLDLWPTSSPATYRIPRGTVLNIGDGPIRPESGIGIIDGQLASQITWYGPIDEIRFIDSTLAQDTLFDGEGKAVRSGQVWGEAPPPGAYTLRSVNRNYRLAGVQGTATFTASFDTRKEESWPPQWRALRILDGKGLQTSRIEPKGAATLVFAALDLSQVTRYAALIADDSVHVEYRAHGAGEWLPLPAFIAGHDFGDPGALGHWMAGTLFQADLTPVTSQIEGPVDLRFHAADPAGNTIELLLEPAFTVGTAGKRRSSAH